MNILYNCLPANTRAKRFIACALATRLLLNCAPRLAHYREYESKRPITVSDRVGEVVDAAERDRFDLLRGIDGFGYAQYYAVLDGGYVVEIVTDNAVYRAVNRDTSAIPILRDYIERNEEILDNRENFVKKWKIVDYDTLGQPITNHETNDVKLPYASAVGGTVTGAIMFFPSIILGLWACGFDWWTGSCKRDLSVGFVTFASTLSLGIAAGVAAGDRADRESALGSIRKAREPYLVE